MSVQLVKPMIDGQPLFEATIIWAPVKKSNAHHLPEQQRAAAAAAADNIDVCGDA
jgi:hypothetical protein